MATNNWKITGTYCETCNCDVACPCVFLSPPTDGECTVLVGWHIADGRFDAVNLDGLNVALAAYAPGPMTQVKWDAALYLDARADEKQKDALVKIFSGQAGGHPALLASFIGKILGVRSVPIDYQAQGKKRSLRVGDVGEAEMEAIAGQGGGDVTVTNHPLCVAPGQPIVTAKSKRLVFKDYGLNWNISEKNGFYSPFSYQG
jgi:hypothetical protein